jgi:hypothetical protein
MTDAKTLIDMYLEYLESVDPLKPKKPKHRSLKQKQGARKAGRTRSRRSYLEAAPGFSHGWLHHYYYHRRKLGGPWKA